MASNLGRTGSLTLDAKGRLASVLRGATPQTFAYDARGRVASIAHGSRARVFGYDATSGMLATVVDPLLQTTTLARDAAGRVTSQTLADGQIAVPTYDAQGNLASVRPPGRGTYQLAHSPIGRLTELVAPPVAGGGTNTTSFLYDADGRLARVTRPDSASAVLARALAPSGSSTPTTASSRAR